MHVFSSEELVYQAPMQITPRRSDHGYLFPLGGNGGAKCRAFTHKFW